MMAKTFKTIRPYTPPAPKPYAPPPDDGTTMVPTMNYSRVTMDAAVIVEGLKWWKASLAVNGMSADPINPNVTVRYSASGDWIVFEMDGQPAFMLDRNSNDLSVYPRANLTSNKLGTLLTLIEKWKRESRGSSPVGAPKYL